MQEGNQSEVFQVESLTGIDKVWVKARQNNACFLSNKIISVLLATSLAIYTGTMKPEIMQYGKDFPDAANKDSYNFIFWLLFIFYSFQALDQLIELYAVYFHREKGALGLLLEMNNFLGIGVIIYITVFNYKEEAKMDEKYAHLQRWINFQVIYLYIQLGVAILMFVCMSSMQRKVIRKQGDNKQQVDGDKKAE